MKGLGIDKSGGNVNKVSGKETTVVGKIDLQGPPSCQHCALSLKQHIDMVKQDKTLQSDSNQLL